MCESNYIEFEDESFNHYIHHYDDVDEDHLAYNDEYDCLEVMVDLSEEIIWE
ncbi:MAG: hypothetical protein RBS14_01090 [Atribacterota bacterium]|jgi:hypothetical protein|nr:hypothetical protein [Atribacterota bacterium]